MKPVVVLNGIHTAGKSTVGRALATRGMDYLPEIATELHNQGVDIGAAAGPELQRLLSKLERERDAILVGVTRPVIESWHTAILAHAMLEPSPILHELEAVFPDILGSFRPRVIYLSLDPTRITERGSHIYSAVDEKIVDYYRHLDSNYHEVFARYSLDACYIDATLVKEAVVEKAYNLAYAYFEVKP